MSEILTSWKEIAAYLGKGVRTVQRWEYLFSFPVRRPNGNRNAVIALVSDIDSWVQLHTSERPAADAQLQHLRDRVMFLEAENDRLRQQLISLSIAPLAAVDRQAEASEIIQGGSDGMLKRSRQQVAAAKRPRNGTQPGGGA